MKKEVILSGFRSCPVKHSALTGYLARNWSRQTKLFKDTLYKCDVSYYLGQLPPVLRKRIKAGQVGAVTHLFRQILEDFLIDNAPEIRAMQSDCIYEIPQLGELFGVSCQLETRGAGAYRHSPWEGGVGFVSKLSFPEINAHFALKLFKYLPQEYTGHGPWFEIPTALAANRAEPRDNNPIYMASMKYEIYMLSDWRDGAAVISDVMPVKRNNKNKIFVTRNTEDNERNWAQKRRIDFGETYRTPYGNAKYPVRKLYRTIMNAAEALDVKMIDSIYKNAKKLPQKVDLSAAYNLACDAAYMDIDDINKSKFKFLMSNKRQI